jgi:hypothetical protein
MHTIHIHREDEGQCYELSVDGQFVTASDNEKLIGAAVLEQLAKLGEVCLIGITDLAPEKRAVRQAEKLAKVRLSVTTEAQARVQDARRQPEPWRA